LTLYEDPPGQELSVRRRSHVVIAGSALVATLFAAGGGRAAAPSCTSVASGTPRTLLDRVPSLVASQITPTRDRGVVIAFASYRGSKEFPGARFTVLALDASGCTRWRVSLPGGWPLARPVVPDARSIVVGATARPSAALALTTLSAATGRVLRKDVPTSVPINAGIAPTLLADRHGDVTALFASAQPTGRPGRFEPVTLRLTRRAGAARWERTVLSRGSSAAPSAALRQDGRLVVGYPRRRRFWVRIGPVSGRLGAPIDAGPITENFRSSAVALGAGGTVAAVWEATTYSRPWRLRAAVLPAGSRRFARAAVIGAHPAEPGTLQTPPAAAVHVGRDGRVRVGFGTPNLGQRIMCVTATRSGRFASPKEVAGSTQDGSNALAGMLFGPTGAAVAVLAGLTPAEDAIVNAVARVDGDCRVRSTVPVDRAASAIVAATVDASDRVWMLGQDQASVDARRPLRLTIAG
jgi:hypothetical protein